MRRGIRRSSDRDDLALGLDVLALDQAVEHLVHDDVDGERQVVVEHPGVEARVLAAGEGVALAPDGVERDVTMRGGDDFYGTNGTGTRSSKARGGTGRDEVLLALPKYTVTADLDSSRAVARKGRTRKVVKTPAFEDLSLTARRGVVDGTPGAEQIIVAACRVNVSGDRGKDVIAATDELLDTGLGTVIWILVLGVGGWVVFNTWREANSY